MIRLKPQIIRDRDFRDYLTKWFSNLSVHQNNMEDLLKCKWDFPGGPEVKSLPANAGDVSSIPGLGRSHTPWSKPMGHSY